MQNVETLISNAEGRVTRMSVANGIVAKMREGICPDFGLGSVKVMAPKAKLSAVVEQNGDEMALVAAMYFASAQGHTTDALLAAQLKGWNENHGFGFKETALEDAAIRINRFLIKSGIIKRNSSVAQYVDAETGRLRTGRIWELTDEWEQQVKAALEAARSKAIMFAPLKEGELPKLRESGRLAEVKGNSEFWDRTAKDKIEAVRFTIEAEWRQWGKEALAYTGDNFPESVEETGREISDLLKMRPGEPVQFATRADARGRMYYLGGMVSPQGGKFTRGALSLANKEELTPEGRAACELYAGRLLGSKGTDLEAMIAGRDALGSLDFSSPQRIIEQGVKPKAAYELWATADALEKGVTGLIVRADGSSNGIQHMALITRSRKTAEMVNLLGTEPLDLYESLAVKLSLARSTAKGLIMPYSYGASVGSLAKSLGVTPDMVNEWLKVVNKEVPAIKQFTNAIKLEAELKMQEAEINEWRWELPDFSVCVKHEDQDRLYAGSFFVNTSAKSTDARKMLAALPPHIIHSLDAYHMRKVVMACDFDVVVIHDSFGCHPNNFRKLKKAIMETLVEMYAVERVHERLFAGLGFDPFFKNEFTFDEVTNPYMFM